MTRLSCQNYYIFAKQKKYKLAIIILLIFYLRSRKADEEYEEIQQEVTAPVEIPDLPEREDSEATIRKKQLEKIAKEKPEEFAKLLRSWIGEE